MSTQEVTGMIFQALQAMLIGIPGVFLVLGVFYCTLKLLMFRTKRDK